MTCGQQKLESTRGPWFLLVFNYANNSCFGEQISSTLVTPVTPMSLLPDGVTPGPWTPLPPLPQQRPTLPGHRTWPQNTAQALNASGVPSGFKDHHLCYTLPVICITTYVYIQKFCLE